MPLHCNNIMSSARRISLACISPQDACDDASHEHQAAHLMPLMREPRRAAALSGSDVMLMQPSLPGCRVTSPR